MTVLQCDRCGLDFFDYEGFQEIEDEGVVCEPCIDEEYDEEINITSPEDEWGSISEEIQLGTLEEEWPEHGP